MGYLAKVSSTVLVLCLVLVGNRALSAQAATASTGVQTGTANSGAKEATEAKDSSADRVHTGPSPLAATPQVTYQNGLLSIKAANSSFSDVFRAVQQATGIVIEYPATAANERIAVELGPGKPNDVIKDLLNGSSFNYILTGESGDSGNVQRVVLTTQLAPEEGTGSGPARVVDAKTVKPKTATVARRTTSDGRPAEPAILPVAGDMNQSAVINTSVPGMESNPQLIERTNRWMQIDKEHAQRMADPANKDAPPPPPPPME
ncbi:MAG TPA: hypothetical protein VMT53_08105 [Terriglobales bacterium]|nr:hypothetical protein [Terriglobales bacterium]